MRFRLLGPLEIRAGADWRGIGAPKWRSLLAALLINAGRVVPADVLISEVWGETPPARSANLVSIYVLRLRRLLGDTDGAVLVTRAPGYLLRLSPADTDAGVFEELVREGRRAYAAGEPERTAGLLAEALALWHGTPLADVPQTRAGGNRGQAAGRAPPRRCGAADQGRAGRRQSRSGHPRAARAAGRSSAPGRPVAAAHAGPGRRGPPRRSTRRIRAGPSGDLR